MTSSDSGGPAEEPFDPPGPDWLYRWRQRVAGDSRSRQLAWRAVATALGAGVVLAGVVMLPLPGPGWAVIFLGLAVLATEYVWAHRLLRYTRERAQGAASSLLAPQNRRRTLWLAVILVLLAAAVVSLYVERFGWTLDGLSGWFGIG